MSLIDVAFDSERDILDYLRSIQLTCQYGHIHLERYIIQLYDYDLMLDIPAQPTAVITPTPFYHLNL